MELIKNDEPCILQFTIFLDSSGQNSFGDDFNPGSRGYSSVKADLVANGSADWFPQEGCHPGSCGPGRQSSRFQDNYFLFLQPWLLKEGKGDKSGLTGTWRRRQYGRSAAERLFQLRKNAVNG